MTSYSDAVGAIRDARRERDAARDKLYALALRRLELSRALDSARRGHEPIDPAFTRQRRAVHREAATLSARLEVIARRLDELSQLPAKIADVRERLAAAEQVVAQLVRAIDDLGAELARRSAARQDAVTLVKRAQDHGAETAGHSERLRSAASAAEAVVERLRNAQTERGATEVVAGDLRSRLAQLEKSARDGAGEAARLRTERAAARVRLKATQKELDVGERKNGELADEATRAAAAVDEQRKETTALDRRVRGEIAGLFVDRTPQALIEEWNDAFPILLLPLRVETRWKTGADKPELWVRVYPDDVQVVTHEKVLTDSEVEHGRAYWTARRSATDRETREAAWRTLVDRFSANRAAWVALQTKPTNWVAAADDESVALQFPDPGPTKVDAWTVAPHSRVLPDRFVLLGWRGNDLKLNELGPLLDDVVIVGPAPLEDHDPGASITRDEVDNTLALGASFRWVRDFDDAIKRGMAFRVPVDAETATKGLDELLVLGLKHSADANDAKTLVEELIDNHHYARPGFAVLAQGTPTNNTASTESRYSRAGRDGDASIGEVGSDLFTPVADRSLASDGQRLADFLGIAYEPLLHADGADLTDHADAVAMNRALYAGTLGYYLDHMLNEVVDEDALALVRRHYTDFVIGRGPVAAIRVGSQPYGILPTSAFGRWTVRRQAPRGMVNVNDQFEAMIHGVLSRFDVAWSNYVPLLSHIGATGSGATELLDILGLHPTSAEFYQRVGYSYDTLRNIESLVWQSHELADTIKMILESIAGVSYLRQLGYSPQRTDGLTKPIPLLLQLIWRHYHTQLDATQLIDGQPLSESDGVKPYDAPSGRTFFDWLIDHAADAAALEAQDFGNAPRPGSLLYMLLHFSLAMEAARGVHRFLTLRGVNSDELLRSRKFLNVGPRPSPSAWEVFRAPANRVVDGAPSRPLLELMHSPQFANDEGRYVAEQLAALQGLRTLSTARLERALVEHIDTLSYRLDAWQNSLFTRRLFKQRNLGAGAADRVTGLFIGAFGYLQNLRPAPDARRPVADESLAAELRTGVSNLFEQVGNGGYVHGASMAHATAAALLRNGYLTHATPEQPDSLAINLSSDRTRRARYLINGIRNGQSLEVLLGIQFERGLDDWTTRPVAPVILDQLKPVIRAAFPIKRTRVPQAADADGGAGAATVTEDYTVVNGLDLAVAGAFPWGIDALNDLTVEQQRALKQEKDGIANTLDALRDVLTAEAAYQLALGNFDRAAAVVQSVGNGSIPPDIEVVHTPRGTGVSFTNRLAVQLSTTMNANPWPDVATITHRAQLEPALNHWLGTLIPDPAHIVCTVRAEDADDGSELATGTVALADLDVQAIDFVFMVRSEPQESSVAELEARIRYAFAQVNNVPDDAIVRIAFANAGGGARAFAEVLPLADRLRRLVGGARTLNARHFQSASKDAPEPPDNVGRIDVAELRARVGTAIDAVRKLFRNSEVAPAINPLERVLADARAAGAPPNTLDALRAALGLPHPPSRRPRLDRLLTLTRRRLDDPAFAAAWAEGRAMTRDGAIAYALANAAEPGRV